MTKAELRAVAWLVEEAASRCHSQGVYSSDGYFNKPCKDCRECPLNVEGCKARDYYADHIARIIAAKVKEMEAYDDE